MWRCARVIFVGLCSAAFVGVEGLQTNTTKTATSSVSTVTTTTNDPCKAATPCDCAASVATCAWTTYANGGGVCRFSSGATVDCGLCSQQSHCSSTTCGVHFTACACAASPNWCYWDAGSSVCISRTTAATPCSVCSSQTLCGLPRPQAVGFFPANGARKLENHSLLQVTFNVNVKWCDENALHSVLFWCKGSLDKSITKSYLAIVLGNVLKVDLSGVLQGMSRTTERECGIVIHGEQICDSSTLAPFNGIYRGDYKFLLRDTSPPTVANFNPSDGATGVDPSSPVEFTFDEPVTIGASSLFLTLTMLNTDRSGGSGAQANAKQYAFELPNVRMKDGNKLQFDLEGKTSPGWLYSITLPPGAVIDEGGNKFLGLAGGTYTFRIGTSSLRGSEDESGTNAALIVIPLVVGILICGCLLVLATIKVKQHLAGNGHRYMKNSGISGKPPSVPVMSSNHWLPQVDPTEPITKGAPPSSSYFQGTPVQNVNSPQSAPRRTSSKSSNNFNPFKDVDEQEEREESEPPQRTFWGRPTAAGKAAPKRAAQTPAPRLYPQTGGHAGPNARRAGPKPQPQPCKRKVAPEPEPAPATSTSPMVESSCPEARSVEKRMRDKMNEPLAVRKKMLKDLMLEYHPDKNAGANAKEVFQFINGARAWFLNDG